MKVKEIMTTRVVTVAEDTLVADIAAALRGHRISAVPVLDTARAVVGPVSEYDLLAPQGATAREVMTREVITATEDTNVSPIPAVPDLSEPQQPPSRGPARRRWAGHNE